TPEHSFHGNPDRPKPSVGIRHRGIGDRHPADWTLSLASSGPGFARTVVRLGVVWVESRNKPGLGDHLYRRWWRGRRRVWSSGARGPCPPIRRPTTSANAGDQGWWTG